MPRQLVRDFGSCLSFNGTSTDVTVTSQLFYQNTGYTVSLWMKASGKNTGTRFLNLGSTASNNQIWILQNSSTGADHLNLLIRNDANTSVTAAPGNEFSLPVMTGQWMHIVLTDNNGTVKLYVNNVLDSANANYTPSGTYTINRTGIGALVRATKSNFVLGQIDDVRIWNNTVLSATDVSNLYYQGINPSTPTSWYKFDEGSGTTATDSGSSATNGTITGATYSTDVFIKPRTAAGSRQLVQGLGFNGSTSYVSLGTMGNLGSNAATGLYCKFVLQTDIRHKLMRFGEYNTLTQSLYIHFNGNSSEAFSNNALALTFEGNNNRFLIAGANSPTVRWNDGGIHTIEFLVIPGTPSVTITIDGVSQTVTISRNDAGYTYANFPTSLFLGTTNSNGTPSSTVFFTGTIYSFEIGTSSSNIYGSYKLNEGTGTTANDTKGLGSTGTLMGSPLPVWNTRVTTA